MQVEIRHLQLVREVAESGSLTKAADRLHLTQSALSHQLRDIEDRLRTPLFHRVGKRMILTQAGTRMLESAQRILHDLEQAEQDVRLLSEDRRGAIRVTTECITCYHWLPSLMKDFARIHPDVELLIDVMATAQPAAALLEGSIDVALMSSDIDDPRLRAVDLFEDELMVAISPDHRFRRLDHVTAADLATQTLITYSELQDNVAYIRVLKPAGLAPRKHLHLRLTEAIIEMVKAGLGVAVLAGWAIAPYVEAGAIDALPLTAAGLRRRWRGVTLANARSPQWIDDFLRLVAAKGRELSIAARCENRVCALSAPPMA